MNLSYAVDRLYQAGWQPWSEEDAEQLPDGRSFPSVLAVQRDFARAGLDDPVLQTVGQHGDAFRFGVFSEKGFALNFIFAGLFVRADFLSVWRPGGFWVECKVLAQG